MNSEILLLLDKIEKENDIKILYAVESGSRGWGFASKDSDYDVRFIYIHPVDWYLSIDEGEDFIELPINNSLDINGWDIKKALKLLKKSNPPLLEWLTSPIVYIEKYSTAQKLRDVSSAFFSSIPSLYHYLHLAKRTFDEIFHSEQSKVKKYFYVLRPIFACMWIETYNTMPPMEFGKLLSAQALKPEIRNEINKLLEIKTSGEEVDKIAKNPELIDFLSSKIEHYEQYIGTINKNSYPDAKILDRLFQDTLKEVWKG